METLEKRVIRIYEQTKEVKTVYLSYAQLAKKAKCSKGRAFEIIKAYKAQNQAFGLK